MIKVINSIFIFFLALTAQAQEFNSQEHDFKIVTVAEGFKNPWSMAFLPNGDMLVTERPGRLRMVKDGILVPDAIEGTPSVRAINQGGLLEVALHPNFETNNLIYLTYSKPRALDDQSEGTTALIRARLQEDKLVEVEEIFEANAWNERGGHFGSKIAFDIDGYLFMTIGDRQSPPTGDLYNHPAQDLSSHFGTIIRLHDDGSIPKDNPFVGQSSALPEIWSYGHRNPQGLIADTSTGNIWSTEHGPQGGDELNFILPGLNYGWPVIGYGVNYGSGTRIHESSARDGMEQPQTQWTPSIGASGLMIYNGDKFPNWFGDIFAGGLAATHRRLSRISINGDMVMSRESLLHGEYRIRDVRQGLDGYIYLAIDDRCRPICIGSGLTDIVRLEPID
ncbi:MAG: hypothetical protein CMQ51_03805 [Gammaproteobacteria bacterium]|nr:hypothetical protein [Gammaproteobacteria bacterium]|tara:strand:- start:1177 stop:2352 length:1176 start_codon:yes stop_codon:yes gene_type:complete